MEKNSGIPASRLQPSLDPVIPQGKPSMSQLVYHMIVQATLQAIANDRSRMAKAEADLKKAETGKN